MHEGTMPHTVSARQKWKGELAERQMKMRRHGPYPCGVDQECVASGQTTVYVYGDSSATMYLIEMTEQGGG
jgi:hypothetical protein